MDHITAERQVDTWYADWKAGYDRRIATMRDRVFRQLEANRDVYEYAPYGLKRWAVSLPESERPFIPEAMKPEYLTDHLMSRHVGFGWDLEIDGGRYHLGELLPEAN